MLLVAYICSAATGAVIWNVRIGDPASGVVTIGVSISAQDLPTSRALNVVFQDTTIENTGRIVSFRADADDDSANVTRADRSGRVGYSISIPADADNVFFEYKLNPEFYPGDGPADPMHARGKLSAEGAVLRTRTIFPAINALSKHHEVTLALPAGWSALTPWNEVGEHFVVPSTDWSNTEYLVAGELDSSEFTINDVVIRTGALQGATISSNAVANILERISSTFGPIPGADGGPRCVAVVPSGFIHGGSAGERSTVQSPDAVTLAHELFHWWNPGSRCAPDARWFAEGFTTFFGIVFAEECGLIDAKSAMMHFADLQGEMQYLEAGLPIALAAASRESEDLRRSRVMYSKGALLAKIVQGELSAKNLDLNTYVRRIVAMPAKRLTNEILVQEFHAEFGEEFAARFERWIQEPISLPTLPLGQATGKSGSARLLPPEAR